MANTDKVAFRCDRTSKWVPAQAKAERMRRAGYDVDMTAVLNAEVTRFIDETDEQTAARLGLERDATPVPVRRQPFARGGAA